MIARPEEKERVLYEFDAFRVDPVRRILLREGVPVAITPKAFTILLALVERAGEVVEKADLIERVWPGVFVTEANLTQNVFSLRKCLGEKANDNRYIVTVPGQGYLFAGDLRRVERFATTEMAIVGPEPSPAAAPTDLTPTPEPYPPLALVREMPLPAAFPQKPPRRLRRGLAWSGLGLVALLAILTVVHVLQHLGPIAGPRQAGSAGAAGAALRQAIAVLDFKSLSPNADSRWLESAFAEMLTTELAAGGKMRVIRGDTVAQTTRSLALRDPGSLGPPELQKLHDALGADLVVVGTFLPIQGNIRVDLRVMQVPGGDTLTSMVEIGTQNGLFDLVSRIGQKLRDSLGVAALSAQQVREAQALRPSNPDSSRLYAEGLTALHAFDPPGGLRLLQQAAKVDPKSAVIHSGLSQAWSALGYDSRAVDEARQALDLATSLSREDRLAIEGRLFKASKQWDKASETYRSLWTFYPDDVEYGLQLGDSLISGGRNAEAVATFAALRKLPPPAGLDPRIDIAEARSASRLSDFATELRASRAAVEKGRRSGQSLVVAQALIYEGDSLLRTGQSPQDAVSLFRESAELTRKAGYSWGYGQALANVAGALEALGDLDGAEKANVEALGIAQKLGNGIGIASQYLSLGSLHQDRGELPEALKNLELSNEWYVRIGDRLMETRTLNAVSGVLVAQGDLAGARMRCERALALTQALGDAADEAIARDNLGNVLEAQGELTGARRRHEEAFFLLRKRGDASSAAAALAASASAVAKLGDLHTAWQRSAEALATKQQAGDRLAVGRILGLRARLAYQMGDLSASRMIAQDQLKIARETGARSIATIALQSLGRAGFAAGDPAARASLEEGLRVSASLGEELRATEIRLDLAELALAMDQAGEAAVLARQAADWSKSHGVPDGEARALSLLAEAQLRQGQRKEALATAGSARARLDATEDRELRVTVGVRLGKIDAATGNVAAALRQLRRAAEDATGFTLVTASLEARLALGEVQRGAADPAAATTLAAVRKEAETRGFKRLALAAVGPP